MSYFLKLKDNYSKYKKIINVTLLLILLPCGITILDLFLKTIFNLGIYFGTFIHYLYEIVVY